MIASIALSIGASTTVFVWVENLVRRPLPAVQSLNRLVSVAMTGVNGERSVSYPEYSDWRAAGVNSLDGLAAFAIHQLRVNKSPDSPQTNELVWAVFVSDNYFDLLGVQPVAGRQFTSDEVRADGTAPVAIISHALWVSAFRAEQAAIGSRLQVNGNAFTVVGVAPADFGGTYTGLAFDVWIPITMHSSLTGDAGWLQSREARWLQVFGRLRQDSSIAASRTELRTVGARLREAYSEAEGLEAMVKPFDTGAASRLRTLFTVLLGVTGLIALIVCSNVANLLIAKGVSRRAEISTYLALGARPRWVVGQLLTESGLLALTGSILGIAIAYWAQRLLPSLMPPSPLPLRLEGPLDVRVVAFAAALGSAMLLAFGLVPALRTLGGASSLGAMNVKWSAGTRSSVRLRASLVIAQLALSLTALVCAGLFLRTLERLRTIDRGFRNAEQILLVSTDLDLGGYRGVKRKEQGVEEIVSAVRRIPDVRAAAVATFVPLGLTGYSTLPVEVPGYVAEKNENTMVLTNRIGSGYFDTLGVPIVMGRPIDERDTSDAPAVVVINQAFATRYLPNQEPVGLEVVVGSRRARVVGIAANGKYSFDALDEAPPAHIYLPYAQDPQSSVTLHLRSRGSPYGIASAVREVLKQINTELPVAALTTLEDYTALPLFPVRLGTTMLSALGVISLILAATGLYGVMAYSVSQRWKELALRMSLGASARDVITLVVGAGMRYAIIGLAVGVVVAFGLARLLASRLPRLDAPDALTFVVTVGLLGLMAALAVLLPALRVATINLSATLRGE